MKSSSASQKSHPSFCSYVLVLLTIIIWMVGTFLIGFIAWILATSVSLGKFISGTMLFTYAVVGIGFYLFFTGFLGCVGTVSQNGCLVKFYVLVAVLCIASQIGGILTIVILKIPTNDIIHLGWSEVNPVTRNLIQHYLDCCGYEGPKELAYRRDLIDTSCYVIPPRTTIAPPLDSNVTFIVAERNVTRDLSGLRLKPDGCGVKLQQWFMDNRHIWAPSVAGFGLLEILSVVASVYVISHVNKVKRRQKMEKRNQLHAY